MTSMAVHFSSKSDEWATPQDLFDELDGEFGFTLDAAATADNAKCAAYLGPDHEDEYLRDALSVCWDDELGPETVWLNPPYSMCRQFIAKAAQEAREGRATVVCLVPARTDTRWFHEHIWDTQWQRPRPGVEVRFLKGRLKFGGAENGAPFPSMVVIFRRWA